MGILGLAWENKTFLSFISLVYLCSRLSLFICLCVFKMSSQGVNALQKWCKTNTQGYNDVNIRNMTTSWKDGLGFCALIHNFRPDLINFSKLNKENVYQNNKLAFNLAEKELGINAFLDPRDMVEMKRPDRLSIITYVQQYYHYFNKMNSDKGKLFVESDRVSNSSETDETEKENMDIFVTSKCEICEGKVHLVERIVSNGKVYHRHCHRKCSLRRMYGTTESSSTTVSTSVTASPLQKFAALHEQHKSQFSANPFVEDEKVSTAEAVVVVSKASSKSSLTISDESSSEDEEEEDHEESGLNPFGDEEDDIVDAVDHSMVKDEISTPKPNPLTAPLIQELPRAKTRSSLKTKKPTLPPKPKHLAATLNPFLMEGEEEEIDEKGKEQVTSQETDVAPRSKNPFGDEFEDEEEEEDTTELGPAETTLSSNNPFGDELEEEFEEAETKPKKKAASNPFLEDGVIEEEDDVITPPVKSAPKSARRQKPKAPAPPQ